MTKIIELSNLYLEYKIFSLSTYHQSTPLQVFQTMFPENDYSKAMDVFLKQHDYLANKRGADLPWWGKSYFENNKEKKCMIISQDSLSLDSGSVAFYAHIMQEVKSEEDYKGFYCRLDKEYQKFVFGNWSKIREMIVNWGISFDNLFITDASKVYVEGSKDRFNMDKSKELLQREIEFCNPDILILLGSRPLNIIAPEYIYSDVVDKGQQLYVGGVNIVVCPFPVGNGRSQKNFHERMNNATRLIQGLYLK